MIREDRARAALGFTGGVATKGLELDAFAASVRRASAVPSGEGDKAMSLDAFVSNVNAFLAARSVRNVSVSGRVVTWTAPDWTWPTRYIIETRNATSGSWTARGAQTGLSYTAPSGVRQVRITPVTSAGNAKAHIETLGLPPTLTARISNSISRIIVGGTHTFTVTTTGGTGPATSVWSATRGTITSAGVYTAPATAGSDTVTFTYTRNGVTITATDTFTVFVAATTLTVSIGGARATLAETSFFDLTAVIGGTATGAIAYSWSVTAGQLTPSATSRTPRWNPPDVSVNTNVTISVTVTRGGITASDSFVVTVTPAAASSPTATILNPISRIETGATHDFNADITGGTGAVTNRSWSARRGTMSAIGGVYTAPSTAGSDTVTFSARKGGVLVTASVTFMVTVPITVTALISPSSPPDRRAGQTQVFTLFISGTATGTPSFAWSASGGSFVQASNFDFAGDSIRWTAPSTAGDYVISCTVTRGGVTATDSATITVV